jgi:hypothetical protein
MWRLGSRAGRPLVANERGMSMGKKIGRAIFDFLIFASPTRARGGNISLSSPFHPIRYKHHAVRGLKEKTK